MHPRVPCFTSQAPPNNYLALRVPPPSLGLFFSSSTRVTGLRVTRDAAHAGGLQSRCASRCIPSAQPPRRLSSRRGGTDHPDHPAGPGLNTSPTIQMWWDDTGIRINSAALQIALDQQRPISCVTADCVSLYLSVAVTSESSVYLGESSKLPSETHTLRCTGSQTITPEGRGTV